MTPYRERREEGFCAPPENEKPESVHAHHLPGLLTAARTEEPEAEEEES